MWNKVEHDFGTINTGSKLTYTFENDGSKNIKEVNPSCNCMSIKRRDKTLTVSWQTPDKIKESYESFKYVYVIYIGGEIEILTLKATLVL